MIYPSLVETTQSDTFIHGLIFLTIWFTPAILGRSNSNIHLHALNNHDNLPSLSFISRIFNS